MPRYAPPLLKSEKFGYFLSAMARHRAHPSGVPYSRKAADMKRTFVEKSIAGLAAGMSFAALAEASAREQSGALQRVDPRVKLAGMFALIVGVAASHSLSAIGAVFLLAVTLAIASRVALADLAKWYGCPCCCSADGIALPAVFLTPGDRIGLATVQGLRTAAFLLLRAETAVAYRPCWC